MSIAHRYPGSVILRFFAFVCFVLDVILIAIEASTPKLDAALVPLGLALWVLSTFVP